MRICKNQLLELNKSDKKIRVLHILGSLSYGGIESMLLNYQKFIDIDLIQFDYVTCSEEISKMEKEFIKTGANIYHVCRRRKNIFRHIKQLLVLLLKNKKNYNIIHVHMNNEGYIPLFLAWIIGYQLRIAHSHTSYIGKELNLLTKIKCFLTRLFANQYAACSETAGFYLFNKKVKVLNNCINYQDYYYDEKSRTRLRESLNIDNKFIITYVARLDKGKNHEFICHLAKQKLLDGCIFLIIGSGSERSNIEELISHYGIGNVVYLLGDRKDVKELLSASDLFIIPSEHEGFPMVLIEAQVNGLKCISSIYVSREVAITNSISFLDIKNTSEWVEYILEIKKQGWYPRTFKGSYTNNIKNYIKKLEDYYMKLVL